MAPGMNYDTDYERAKKAYLQGEFEEAAEILDRLYKDYSDDATILLLRGHVYCYGLHQYETAQSQYQAVLQLSGDDELTSFAERGLEQIGQWQQQSDDSALTSGFEVADSENDNEPHTQLLNSKTAEADTLEGSPGFLTNDFGDESNLDLSEFSDGFGNVPIESAGSSNYLGDDENPFIDDERTTINRGSGINDLSASSLDDEVAETDEWSSSLELEDDFSFMEDSSSTQTVTQRDENNLPPGEEPTFVVSSDLPDPSPGGLDYLSVDHSKFKGDETNLLAEEAEDSEFLSSDDDFEMSEDDFSSFQDDISQIHDQLSEFELSGGQQTEIVDTPSGRFSPEAVAEPLELDSSSSFVVDEQDTADFEALESGSVLIDGGEELLTGLSGAASEQLVKPQVDENVQASLPFLANAPLLKKQLICAAATGVATFLSVVIAGFLGGNESVPSSGSVSVSGESGNKGVMALVAGVVGFGSTLAVGQISTIQMKRSINNLQEQFDHVLQGNLDARATVYAEDELGRLSSSFNEMSRVVLTTTKDAQRRAEETEQAREDLQRQVIRLLDEVEGAARGDLTVQAEVTADVLGAVADAFNLTIQNLREIVQQVKQAALQVNRGSTDSESFARNQSSDALRMAEELAVTLNSVQMMTESIQRVAENAREAEEVARTSSGTALRGGKAVERTVAGILQIRETVSETARKVKRLAEASQEISKIVALISQIASRTNLLALNASIQAARAGEAGRGFAIVADEVRQLADRSAKSLKEIEQIVLQIQSETGSVMTAMEEGIQQVIDVTDRAEQAKKSLEDIIEVSNHIDSLVRSITADTVEQRENSLAVAQVMQSVELTAQETSQESQRVAGSLQNLVSISQELLASVERFRVNAEAG